MEIDSGGRRRVWHSGVRAAESQRGGPQRNGHRHEQGPRGAPEQSPTT